MPRGLLPSRRPRCRKNRRQQASPEALQVSGQCGPVSCCRRKMGNAESVGCLLKSLLRPDSDPTVKGYWVDSGVGAQNGCGKATRPNFQPTARRQRLRFRPKSGPWGAGLFRLGSSASGSLRLTQRDLDFERVAFLAHVQSIRPPTRRPHRRFLFAHPSAHERGR